MARNKKVIEIPLTGNPRLDEWHKTPEGQREWKRLHRIGLLDLIEPIDYSKDSMKLVWAKFLFEVVFTLFIGIPVGVGIGMSIAIFLVRLIRG